MRVLVVEDDQRLASLIQRMIVREHYAVDVAHDGAMGLEYALSGAYTLAIVDWMVPGRDGLALCQAIRKARVPLGIIMLTARSQVSDRVTGLEYGADDYLVKPFAFEELLARVRALSRRFTVARMETSELHSNNITLDLRTHTAMISDRPLHLTETEWNLLECFMRHPGQALTRKQIFEQVWGLNSDAQPSMVDVYVSYLRQKLNPGREKSNVIETVRGVGYRINT